MLRVVAGTAHEPDDDAPEHSISYSAKLIEHAHAISNLLEGDVAGFFIVGIRSDGSHSTGWQLDPDNPFMGSTLFGAFVAEIARREIITQSEVVDVLNRGPTASDDGA
jgi:hypothetical protein